MNWWIRIGRHEHLLTSVARWAAIELEIYFNRATYPAFFPQYLPLLINFLSEHLEPVDTTTYPVDLSQNCGNLFYNTILEAYGVQNPENLVESVRYSVLQDLKKIIISDSATVPIYTYDRLIKFCVALSHQKL